MTIRDVLYDNSIEIEANIRIGLFVSERGDCSEFNPDIARHREILDEYLDKDITYIAVREADSDILAPYIYMEATID